MSAGPAAAIDNTVALIESLTPTTSYDSTQKYVHDPKAGDPDELQDVTRVFGVFWDGAFEYVREARASAVHEFSSYEIPVDVVINYRETRGSKYEAQHRAIEDAQQLLKQLPRIAGSAYDTVNTGLTIRRVESVNFDGGRLTLSVVHRLNIGG